MNDPNGSNDSNDPNDALPLQLRTIGQVRDSGLTLARELHAEHLAEGDLILSDEVAIAHEGISPVVSIAPESAR